MSTSQGRWQQDPDLPLQLALDPFTLVIELDAWNIRERDEDWGRSAALRSQGQEPSRWHWAYGGTCFRLNQRAQTAGGRPVILSRGTVMTRGGVDALKGKKGEPLGRGAMESTCRQDQVRFKRTGQFWSQTGDEALMCLETFRRNGRWHRLFPHTQSSDLSKN